MKVLHPGHRYELAHLDGVRITTLQFVQRAPLHPAQEGTTCQEVLRALIDRVKVLDAERPWGGNTEILLMLRRALILFETRALIRKVEREELEPERLAVDAKDGHWLLTLESAPE